MSVHSSAFKPSKNLLRSSPAKHPGSLKKTGSEVFVGNLPSGITEMEIKALFKDFGLKSIRIRKNCAGKSFAFLEVASPEVVQLAVQTMNGNMVKGHRILVAISEERPRSFDSKKIYAEMPDLEPVSNGLPVSNDDLVPKPGTQAISPSDKKKLYAIPVEMSPKSFPPTCWSKTPCTGEKHCCSLAGSTGSRPGYFCARSSFLVLMLRDCFKDLEWLISISRISGEAALLVTDTVPQTPFFWAIHLTEESHRNMHRLFTILAEVESQMPFLAKQEVQRGMRCMGECILGDEGGAWNRCWVLDKVGNLALVFFMDFGRSATVPLSSLRWLDREDFWTIQPLAQPFMFHEGLCPPQIMVRQILEGRVVQQTEMEAHILRFLAKTK